MALLSTIAFSAAIIQTNVMLYNRIYVWAGLNIFRLVRWGGGDKPGNMHTKINVYYMGNSHIVIFS